MKSTRYNRREWLRSGLLAAGAVTLLPQVGLPASSKTKALPTIEGKAFNSPFFKEYIPEKLPNPGEIFTKLNANENPYGPSPKAIEAFKNSAFKGNRYGWSDLSELTNSIATKEGVSEKNIMMGPGSSDLLEKTAMVLFMDGGNIVSADPSYMSLIQVAKATGATWKGIALKEDWSHDLKKMEAAVDRDTKLVYICNPNNPTGSLTNAKELLDFCARVSERVPVFVDEAYLDFLEDGTKQSMVSLINEGKNVIIARTFSKIHGMAGLRVGYIMAQEKTLDKIQAITRSGMGISVPSVNAAIASMDDVDFQIKSRSLNAEAKDYVCAYLRKMGYDYVPSFTSFVLFPIAMDGKLFLEKMIAKKVGVRAFTIYEKNWCRVSMGTMEEMKVFTKALTEVLV